MKKVILKILGLLLFFSIILVPIKCMAKNEVSNTIGIKYTIWDDDYYKQNMVMKSLYFVISFLIIGLPTYFFMKFIEKSIGDVSEDNTYQKELHMLSVQDVSMEKIYTYLNNENISSLKEKLFLKFVDYKNACSTFDYNKLQTICYSVFYNSLAQVLSNMANNGQIGVSHTFIRKDEKISDIYEDGNLIVIVVHLYINYYNYIQDSSGTCISGSMVKPIEQCVKIEYIISKNRDNIECLNCKRKVFLENNGNCPYCGSPVVIEAKDYLIRSIVNEL